MSLLLEDKLSTAIRSLLSQDTRLRIAVAFIGDGASKSINKKARDVKIICNLTMNGTNPAEVKNMIERFGAENVKQIDNLHAKLYIGSDYAIVGSANMSANGLGTQPTGLREAGYKFKLDQPSGQRSLDWFDDVLWEGAREISDQDLIEAAENWRHRDRLRNGDLKSDFRNICNYDFDDKYFPLLDWIGNADYDVLDDQSIDGQYLGGWDSFNDAVDNGLDIECNEDFSHLTSDRWILTFYPRRNTKPFWTQLSGIVLVNSFIYKCQSNPSSVVVVKKGATKGPFDIDDIFVENFRDLLFGSEKYSNLRQLDYDGCWFHPRVDQMRDFWKELQSKICQK